MDGRVDKWMIRIGRWMDEWGGCWMDGWMGRWMDEWGG